MTAMTYRPGSSGADSGNGDPPAADARALVLFSGGQDSTTCLAWALDRFAGVETVAFAYRQRHGVELVQQAVVRRALAAGFPDWAGRLGRHHDVDLGVLADLSASALTVDRPITAAAGQGELPSTFLPGRNLMFLAAAAMIAGARGIRHLVGGMCETDYAGYPDCRDDAIKAMQIALNLGMATRFVVHTPLMWLAKAATWRLAERLGGAELVALIVEETHTCYQGERGLRHAWGYGCGQCPACRLRAAGYRGYVERRQER
jgi:7-cyano-7-deazaguanine synthase